ncbi:MAG: glycosyltransferase family 4 protein [Anaerolineae bacterium]|nr:glycosyltransferase family 4 protein [Anaerolineae bacterium]
MANILYRGPLERSRLSFLAESTAKAYGQTKLIWISPRRLTKQLVEHFQSFVHQNPWINDWEIVDGFIGASPASILNLRRKLENRDAPLIAVGFTTIFYAGFIAKGKCIWCINGVPEEDLMQSQRAKQRLAVALEWQLARMACVPDLVVTVSEPMNALVKKRCKAKAFFAAPNCVDSGTFASPMPQPRRYMTYLGTGAAWQGLDYLAQVWGALHRLDPSLKFQVISRDKRAQVLGCKLPADAIEFRGVQQPNEVAQLLWAAEAGFITREPHLVNEVSFPTKFGEYIAAGVYPVVTDLGWDLGQIIQKTGCGLLVPPKQAAEKVAEAVIAFRRGQVDINKRLQAAMELLDRRRWVERLAAAMP